MYGNTCMRPFYLKTEEIYVPCGKCPHCLSGRISGWSFRLSQEAKICSSAYFITLTYDSKNLPRSRNKFPCLSKRHVQLFIKRLRRAHAGSARSGIRYYAVGEYGSKTRRPHYHLLLFNCRVEKIQHAWSVDRVDRQYVKYRRKYRGAEGRYIRRTVSEYRGQVHYGQVTQASVGYCLKYMSKPPMRRMHRNDDRELEFSLFSKGLGASYLTEQMVRWHRADMKNRMYVNLGGGQKARMPRYFKKRIYSDEERALIAPHQISRAQEKQLREINELYDGQADLYFQDLASAREYAYRRMYHDSLTNRNLAA